MEMVVSGVLGAAAEVTLLAVLIWGGSIKWNFRQIAVGFALAGCLLAVTPIWASAVGAMVFTLAYVWRHPRHLFSLAAMMYSAALVGVWHPAIHIRVLFTASITLVWVVLWLRCMFNFNAARMEDRRWQLKLLAMVAAAMLLGILFPETLLVLAAVMALTWVEILGLAFFGKI